MSRPARTTPLTGTIESAGRQHYLSLDGLRGAAVLFVVAAHAGLTPQMPFGSAGVTIFFVLSGFLITTVILRARQANAWSFREFFGNRLIRLVPALILMEVVISGWWLLLGHPWQELVEYVLTATFYLENFFHAAHNNEVLSHTWSLSVEEQFYLVWPFLVPLALRSRRWATGLLIALISSSIALRFIAAHAGFVDDAYASIFTNAYALLIGCAVSLANLGTLNPKRRPVAVAFICTGMLLIVIFGRWLPDPNIPIPVVTACLTAVLLVLILPGSGLFEVRPLRFIGRISYALYLWHWPLMYLTGTLEDQFRSLPVVLLSIAIAMISTIYIEEPLRRHWRARRSRRATSSNLAVKGHVQS